MERTAAGHSSVRLDTALQQMAYAIVRHSLLTYEP